MTTLAPANWKVMQMPPGPVRRFTVDEYHRMIQVGLLTEEDRVELLEGWIVLKMPRTPPHYATIDLASEMLRRGLPGEWRIRVQSAITTSDSEPEPDIAVVRGPARRYAGQHPTPADIALLVEVSGTSIDHDRDVKGPLYARARIPFYWIINLGDERGEVYSVPVGAAYTHHEAYSVPLSVPLLIGGQVVATVPVRDLLA